MDWPIDRVAEKWRDEREEREEREMYSLFFITPIKGKEVAARD